MGFQSSGATVSLPTSQIQTTFFKAATDTNQDGSLTRNEVVSRRNAISQQLATSQFPTGSAALTALNTENTLLGGLLTGNNFNRLANSRGLGDDQIRTLDFRPEDATIQANELAAAARVTGSGQYLSNVDLQQLANGAPIPSANGNGNPQPLPQPPGLPGNGGGNLQQLLLTLILRLLGINLPTTQPTPPPVFVPQFPPGSPENPAGIVVGDNGFSTIGSNVSIAPTADKTAAVDLVAPQSTAVTTPAVKPPMTEEERQKFGNKLLASQDGSPEQTALLEEYKTFSLADRNNIRTDFKGMSANLEPQSQTLPIVEARLQLLGND